MYQVNIVFATQGKSLTEITADINQRLKMTKVETGLCHLFIQHTSASLIISENSDPDVLSDLEDYMERLVKDNDPHFLHTAEGEDDMSAHIRTVLTQTSLTIPIQAGKLALGSWQGVYVWEHRYGPHQRQVVMTVLAG